MFYLVYLRIIIITIVNAYCAGAEKDLGFGKQAVNLHRSRCESGNGRC